MARWPTWRQKLETFESVGYTPLGRQQAAHESVARVLVAMGAERAGKSKWTGMETLADLPWCYPHPVAVCADKYTQTRKEIQYIIEGLSVLGGLQDARTPDRGAWSVTTLGGVLIHSISLHSGPRELTGTGNAYALVLLVEAGLISYESFMAARSRTSETRGRVLLSGTPWDNFGWYPEMADDCKLPGNAFEGETFNFPAWDNTAIFPGGREDPEIKRLERILETDDFARRVGGMVPPSRARMYPQFRVFDPITMVRRHVRDVPYVPGVAVELAVDVGYYPSKYAVLAIQPMMEQFTLPGGSVLSMEVIRVIDELWANWIGTQDAIEWCRTRPWWGDVRCAVGGHETKQHAPGGRFVENVADIWHAQVGQVPGDPEEFWFETFDAGRIVPGAQRVRTFLVDPGTCSVDAETGLPRQDGVARLWVDESRCKGIQAEFKAYKRKTDGNQVAISEQPEDKNNDAMDALRDWTVWKYGLVDTRPVGVTGGRERAVMRG